MNNYLFKFYQVGVQIPNKAPDKRFCVTKSKKVRSSIDKLSEEVHSLLDVKNCDTRMAMEVKINAGIIFCLLYIYIYIYDLYHKSD
jgi:hypothetical protein